MTDRVGHELAHDYLGIAGQFRQPGQGQGSPRVPSRLTGRLGHRRERERGQQAATARLTARMDRQHRLLEQKNPPPTWIIVDEMALYRLVGSHDVMAAQMRHLLAVAAIPPVTLTVMPAIAHAANASGFVLADDAAWSEHLAAGGVYTDPQIVSALAARFDSLRAESYRASESAAMIAKAGQLWTAGVNPATQTATAASA